MKLLFRTVYVSREFKTIGKKTKPKGNIIHTPTTTIDVHFENIFEKKKKKSNDNSSLNERRHKYSMDKEHIDLMIVGYNKQGMTDNILFQKLTFIRFSN